MCNNTVSSLSTCMWIVLLQHQRWCTDHLTTVRFW